MRDYALFLNGVFETVMQEILRIQEPLPDCVLYLQPYARDRIVRLAEEPPSLVDPVQLFISTTDHLAQVQYVCEIVGWEDKREMHQSRIDQLSEKLRKYQPGEEGVYGLDEPGKGPMVNLLHVRRMHELNSSFSVGLLRNIKDGQPLSTDRTRAGGWVYVIQPEAEWIEQYR
jgi:hypothetical protein